MQPWVRGGVYFVLVFSVGFVLGTVRVLLLVPVMGERWAEILEAPVMVLASFLSARFAVRRYPSPKRLDHLASGIVALALLLIFEFTVVLGLRGMSIQEYFDSRDPAAGLVYLASLIAFAVMPWWVSRGARAAA